MKDITSLQAEGETEHKDVMAPLFITSIPLSVLYIQR